MKLLASLVCSAAALLLALPVSAQEKTAPAKDEVAIPKDYPLTTCVVTDEKFGEHGEPPVAYRHQESGKPDRIIVLCCEHCIADFKGNPARYLKKFDEAVAKAKDPASEKEDAKARKQEAPSHKH